MARSEKSAGELYVMADVVLMALLPVVATLTYGHLSSMNSLAWSSLFAALVLGALVYKKKAHELRDPRVWKYGILSGFYIALLYYGLLYAGLAYTSPGNASILLLFSVLTAFVFFNVIRRERFPRAYIAGSALMVAGAFVVLARGWQSPNLGDLLILLATAVQPVGNLYQQKGRDIASSETLLFLRTAFAAVVLFAYLYGTGALAPLHGVEAALPYLLFNSVAVFVLAKIAWIEGIHRMSVTKALALSALGPLFTLFFAWLILAQAPTVWQLLSLAPFIAGTLLLTDQLPVRARRIAI